ncbi:MAG: hypothetical protein M1370_00670 [Bacteroidetes bacterium]|nr:hypothetical protein [Bacteroidota bacterium]MCL5027289.1 hypothetical protein [Chloroflexota bacterium]
MMDTLIEGLVTLGLAFLAVAWLAYRHSLLERRVEEMETTLPALRTADARGFEETVAEMIDELKTAASDACDEVAQTIEDLRGAQGEQGRSGATGDVPAVLSRRIEARRELPVERIAQLAERGLTVTEIAKQAGVGPAEVALTLRYHHRKSPSLGALRRIDGARRDTGEEVAVA